MEFTAEVGVLHSALQYADQISLGTLKEFDVKELKVLNVLSSCVTEILTGIKKPISIEENYMWRLKTVIILFYKSFDEEINLKDEDVDFFESISIIPSLNITLFISLVNSCSLGREFSEVISYFPMDVLTVLLNNVLDLADSTDLEISNTWFISLIEMLFCSNLSPCLNSSKNDKCFSKVEEILQKNYLYKEILNCFNVLKKIVLKKTIPVKFDPIIEKILSNMKNLIKTDIFETLPDVDHIKIFCSLVNMHNMSKNAFCITQPWQNRIDKNLKKIDFEIFCSSFKNMSTIDHERIFHMLNIASEAHSCRNSCEKQLYTNEISNLIRHLSQCSHMIKSLKSVVHFQDFKCLNVLKLSCNFFHDVLMSLVEENKDCEYFKLLMTDYEEALSLTKPQFAEKQVMALHVIKMRWNNFEEYFLWLIKFGELGKPEIYSLLMNCSSIVTSDHVKIIIDRIKNNEFHSNEDIFKIVITYFKCLNTDLQSEVILHAHSPFVNSKFEYSNIDSPLTLLFNQLADKRYLSNKIKSEFSCFCLQSPSKVLQKVIDCAVINDKVMDHLIKIISMFTHVCDIKDETTDTTVVCELLRNKILRIERKFYDKLIKLIQKMLKPSTDSKIQLNSLVSSFELFSHTIYKFMSSHLNEITTMGQVDTLLVLKIFKVTLDNVHIKDNFISEWSIIPILYKLFLLLKHTSDHLCNFHHDFDQISTLRSTLLDVINKVIELLIFVNTVSEQSLIWLNHKLMSLHWSIPFYLLSLTKCKEYSSLFFLLPSSLSQYVNLNENRFKIAEDLKCDGITSLLNLSKISNYAQKMVENDLISEAFKDECVYDNLVASMATLQKMCSQCEWQRVCSVVTKIISFDVMTTSCSLLSTTVHSFPLLNYEEIKVTLEMSWILHNSIIYSACKFHDYEETEWQHIILNHTIQMKSICLPKKSSDTLPVILNCVLLMELFSQACLQYKVISYGHAQLFVLILDILSLFMDAINSGNFNQKYKKCVELQIESFQSLTSIFNYEERLMIEKKLSLKN